MLLHIRLDMKKSTSFDDLGRNNYNFKVASWVMALVVISTILSFIIMFLFLIGFGPAIVQTGLLFDPPLPLSVISIGLILLGILLHSWSRFVRQEMASSWAMSTAHTLITKGPYARVRHPSYTSYMVTFIGLFLFIPSLMTMLTLVGIPGYYFVAKTEEELLLVHFGDDYEAYIEQTGRFLPF